jgi:hypothetical protein
MTSKKRWSQGPWLNEPDRETWVTLAGLPGLIRRNPGGALCGYVAVPESHPLHGIGYSEEVECLGGQLKTRMQQPVGEHPSFAILLAGAFGGELGKSPDVVFVVHGGLTFAGRRRNEEPESWWFGFDCSHYGDYSPAYDKDDNTGEYRDIEYVRAEVESLAAQLAAVGEVN